MKNNMKTLELINWIRKWNPHAEHITLATLFAKMRFNKGRTNVINFGPCGTGKSRSTLELIQALDLGTEIILDNTTTDKGLFETFQNYPEQDIILDECSTLLKSLKTQDMVKTVIEGKPLTWTKDGSSQTTEPFKGNLIINANVSIAETVVDRCLLNKTIMNREMSLSFNKMFVKEYLNKTDFTPFINHLKKILLDPAIPELTDAEIEHVLNFTQEHIKDLDRNHGYSRRIIIRELSYFQHAKKLFGNLNKNVLLFIEPYAQAYILNAQPPGLIESLVADGPIEKAQLVKRIANDGNYSEQHARKLVNRELDNGTLKLRGKMVEAVK